jgi:hypothetical protein
VPSAEEDDADPEPAARVTVFRLAWHSGFGGTATGETTDPVQFIKELREKHGASLDFVEVFGAYQAAARDPD